MYRVNGKEYVCSVAIAQDIFNDKWKLRIIWHLLEGEKRYKDLFEEVRDITQKTLTVKLRDLEEKKIDQTRCFRRNSSARRLLLNARRRKTSSRA